MNEKITELAEYCDFYVGNEHYNKSSEEKQRLWTEKFAELIIQECLSKIENEALQYASPVWAVELTNDIKDHFGVKE